MTVHSTQFAEEEAFRHPRYFASYSWGVDEGAGSEGAQRYLGDAFYSSDALFGKLISPSSDDAFRAITERLKCQLSEYLLGCPNDQGTICANPLIPTLNFIGENQARQKVMFGTLRSSHTRPKHDVPTHEKPSHFEAITVHLERLRDGWSGPESKAPPDNVIDDLRKACIAIQQIAVSPSVEVDDDGEVIFEWQRDGQAFCLTFSGNGYVIGTLSPWTPGYPAWRVPVQDEVAIVEKLEHDTLQAVIARQ